MACNLLKKKTILRGQPEGLFVLNLVMATARDLQLLRHNFKWGVVIRAPTTNVTNLTELAIQIIYKQNDYLICVGKNAPVY